ncbi:MAG: hypothetical protein KatS3mg077_1948 [Candidatus Binatia bacterium]|nr:MAG: hypothetical protein KatS3mg077_1948 [Candidatus Binatia bacterium]
MSVGKSNAALPAASLLPERWSEEDPYVSGRPVCRKKILGERALLREIARRRRAGQRIVFTNGCFDLLHPGHVRYLRAARRLGDVLVVAINSDASVRRLKGPSRPLVPQQDRAEVLAALEVVDLVTIFDDDTPERLIRKILPDVLVKGGDWPVSAIVGADVVRAQGGRVRSLPYARGYSTSALVQRILTRQKKSAAPTTQLRNRPT